MKKLKIALVLSLFALTSLSAFAGDDKKCAAEKGSKKSCCADKAEKNAKGKSCAADKEAAAAKDAKDEKTAVKPAAKAEGTN